MGERGIGPKSLVERVNRCRELGCRSAVCLCCVLVSSMFDGFVMIPSGLAWIDPMPFNGASCFIFYRLGKSTGYSGGKEENEREREPNAFRIAGSFFSFMRVPPTL